MAVSLRPYQGDVFAAVTASVVRGYIIRLGHARAIFLSAQETSRVVGHTAHLLLEVDESQDVGKEKYTKEFRPALFAASDIPMIE